MKIAIQGHPTRGKEVIQILENLGGINRIGFEGSDPDDFYYISGDNNAIQQTCVRPQHLGVFTLEEFEKEFPFKIGDKVTTIWNPEIPHTVVGLKNTKYGIRYQIDHYGNDGIVTYTNELTPYKEMEKRNITLTLDKAQEWYKKGGELKEIALQAFTEKELNPLPRSWKEFAANNARMGYYISADGKPLMCASSGKLSSPHVCPSKKSAEAHLAMIQLEQLRNCYNNSCNDTSRIAIINNNGNIELYVNPPFNCFLTFKNHLLAREFFSNFKEIIEIAKELI